MYPGCYTIVALYKLSSFSLRRIVVFLAFNHSNTWPLVMRKCFTKVKIYFYLSIHISRQCSLHLLVVVYVAKGFYGSTNFGPKSLLPIPKSRDAHSKCQASSLTMTETFVPTLHYSSSTIYLPHNMSRWLLIIWIVRSIKQMDQQIAIICFHNIIATNPQNCQ